MTYASFPYAMFLPKDQDPDLPFGWNTEKAERKHQALDSIERELHEKLERYRKFEPYPSHVIEKELQKLVKYSREPDALYSWLKQGYPFDTIEKHMKRLLPFAVAGLFFSTKSLFNQVSITQLSDSAIYSFTLSRDISTRTRHIAQFVVGAGFLTRSAFSAGLLFPTAAAVGTGLYFLQRVVTYYTNRYLAERRCY